jgi:hypothetical protein
MKVSLAELEMSSCNEVAILRYALIKICELALLVG